MKKIIFAAFATLCMAAPAMAQADHLDNWDYTEHTDPMTDSQGAMFTYRTSTDVSGNENMRGLMLSCIRNTGERYAHIFTYNDLPKKGHNISSTPDVTFRIGHERPFRIMVSPRDVSYEGSSVDVTDKKVLRIMDGLSQGKRVLVAYRTTMWQINATGYNEGIDKFNAFCGV